MRARLLGLALVLTVGCHKPDAGAKAELTSTREPPIWVKTTPVVELPMPEHLTLTGTLKASQESEVAADASGKVTATFVERGQRVNKGDVLAVLDARAASITATAANAQTNLAKSQLEQAQRECDRVKQLFQTGAISRAEYDRTTSQCQANEWAAAAAQAQQQSAQKIVGDAMIRAPFAGVVGERFVNVGQYVQPATKVVSLYAPDPLRLELTVPEANVSAVRLDLPVRFTVSSFGDQTFAGAVKFISPNVRPSTRDLVVEAVCPNPDGKLRPGTFAVAELDVSERPMPAVPKSAIKKDETGARVFVIAGKRIQERIVQLGGEKDGLVGVVLGVKKGDTVVDAPGPDVRDGAEVE